MPRQITCMGSTCISLNAFLMVKAMVWKRCKIDGKNCIVKDKKSSVFFGSQCVGTLWNQKSTEVIEKQWSFQQRSITSKKKKRKKNIIINKFSKYSFEHIIEKLHVLLIKIIFSSHYTES